MAEDTAPSEVEFLSALDDAYLRLACFQTILSAGNIDVDEVQRRAQLLYDWIMDCKQTSDPEPDELTATTSEAQCTRKH